MSRKTKIGITILIIILIIAIVAVVVAFINPFDKEASTAETFNNIQVNNEEENIEVNNTEENNVETNNVVNEENVENIIENTTSSEDNTRPSVSDNANNSNEEKAIELVKNEWGEDDGVYFDLAGVTSDGKYRVSVNRDTKVLAWYIVDIENETVTQK